MDLEKIFNDLESNQNQESEEAKRKLVELFTQNKEQYLVHYMMEYYLKTASVRIVEVLVKVQSPHDGFIFDRLADWLKVSSHRIHALNLFCFVVRKHPTWLFKVEKHRLIKDMLNWLKQLEIEKEIVPLMSALLAIITLLPIIPNLVPNFLNDLFAVFAHLATWNNQNPNRLSEDKLVHLQLGLQMLFYRLYGMFPCNFMSFLTEFTKREKGSIFQHTIKPLLETVRLHPMLVTATAESEINCERWKEIQPHDVVVECMRLSLPFRYHDASSKSTEQKEYTAVCYDSLMATSTTTSTTMVTSKNSFTGITHNANQFNIKHQQQQHYQSIHPHLSEASNNTNSSILWSPYHEIINVSHVPLTPTQAPYLMPASSTKLVNRTNFGVTGCSPPEAAVEATPETTPLKDNREFKRSSMGNTTATINNPLAVRAIFASSQPSSPLKNNLDGYQHQYQHGYSHFHFPDTVGSSGPVIGLNDGGTTYVEQEYNTKIVTRITTTDRRVKQMLQDRKQSQSPFQTIEAQANKVGVSNTPSTTTATTSPEICFTPEVEAAPPSRYCQPPYNQLSNITATPTPIPTPTPSQISTPLLMMQETLNTEAPILTKVCDECNETEQTMCTVGGLQVPTSRSVQLLAKGIKRRNRMTSYCYNENSYEKNGDDNDAINGNDDNDWYKCESMHKIRRTKSCSSIPLTLYNYNNNMKNILGLSAKYNDVIEYANGMDNNNKYVNISPLQKSNRMIAIPSAFQLISTTVTTNTTTTSSTNNSGHGSDNKENIINHNNKKVTVIDKCVQTIESVPALNHELSLLQMLLEGKEYRNNALMENSAPYQQTPNEILEQFIVHGLKSNSGPNSVASYDHEQFQLLCLQLQYERYRREIHAERNRRLMGRSRDKRSLEMERDRLKEQLIDFEAKNHKLNVQLDKTIKIANDREREYQRDLEILKRNYQNELDENQCLRQAKELLENNIKSELAQRKEIHYELDSLRNQVFSLTTELQHAQDQANIGAQCKQELIRLEADFILMGEMQSKCRERLMGMENFKARDEELQMLQDAYNIELRDLKHSVDDKTSQLDSTRSKLQELQAQVLNYEKVMTEQKRLLRAVKDEYEEKFKALNKKYEIQKTIIMQIEEKYMMLQQKPMPLYNSSNTCCSPDTDKTDIASSVERNSPLSTSLASSESLSTSLRSSELRNLQQLVEPSSVIPEINTIAAISSSSSSGGGVGALDMSAAVNITLGQEITSLDLASSANTASNIIQTARDSQKPNSLEGDKSTNHNLPSTSNAGVTHRNPRLQKPQLQKQHTKE